MSLEEDLGHWIQAATGATVTGNSLAAHRKRRVAMAWEFEQVSAHPPPNSILPSRQGEWPRLAISTRKVLPSPKREEPGQLGGTSGGVAEAGGRRTGSVGIDGGLQGSQILRELILAARDRWQ